jgi:hypothetical protein
MLASTLIVFLAAAAPLSSFQQERLAALLVWADTYRRCYEPAPFSEKIDQPFTAECIERALRHAEDGNSRDGQAALQALIAETPRLVSALNAPRVAGARHRTGVR